MDYSLSLILVKQLDRDIIELSLRGMENKDEARFNELALREFELQYHTIGPYRDYCEKSGQRKRRGSVAARYRLFLLRPLRNLSWLPFLRKG